MTVIAWDGKTLAADKRACISGVISIVTKIRKINGNLVGFSGDFAVGMELYHWYENGANKSDYPELQKKEGSGGAFVIITPEKKIFRYEATPHPYEIEQQFYAFGSGIDFALAAMEMGATAERAVLIASKWCDSCGNGVDYLSFDD